MPRAARLDLPDLLQHVVVRGGGCEIFADDDRRHFLDRLSTLLAATQTECLAWALMPNHLHLLLCPRQTCLADLMRRLLTGYALYVNRRHQRFGHLFQNRYKSPVCDADPYLLELVRNIRLNSLRAGLIADLGTHECHTWSGRRRWRALSRPGVRAGPRQARGAGTLSHRPPGQTGHPR